MQNPAPKIDKRDTEKILEEIRTLAPYYVPELNLSEEKDAGTALLKIFASMQKLVIDRLNRVPEKNFVAFLDTLGIKLLPAQPATAPITFYLSNGRTENVLIPEKTQTAAGDIIFETERNMVATPSRLKNAYSIDVKNDKIYESPPNIVSGERAVAFETRLLYDASKGDEEIFVSSSKGLNEKDLLIIEGEDTTEEYGIVSEVSDSRVKLLHKLENGHNANIPVRKVTSFELFKGKNLQEHTLYLGHKDLFNIKEMAEIGIRPFHTKLAEKNLVQWEYWGEDDKKKVGWHQLTIKNSSQSDETVNLKKEHTGEIKKHKINGIESRWLRCRTENISETKSIQLDDPLQISIGHCVQQVSQYHMLPPRAIRDIGETFGERLSGRGINTVEELLKFEDRVDDLAEILRDGREPSMYRRQAEKILENAQKHIIDKEYEEKIGEEGAVTQGIPPDMAFYNDVPLDLTLSDGQLKTPIYPFGNAPRMYDTFYIASQEAFSKKGANITLDVEVEPRGVLGAPTAITFTTSTGYDQKTEKIKVFARGSYGRLIELEIDPYGKEEPVWTDHGFPPDTTIALKSTPSAVTDESRFISVFARAENGHLFERFYNGDQWQWIDRDAPEEGLDRNFDPAAVWLSEKFCVNVFVVGVDGHLYRWEQKWDQKAVTPWVDLGTPKNSIRVDGSPFVTSYGGSRVYLFVRGSNGHLYEWNNIDNDWKDHGSPDGETVDSRPFAEVHFLETNVYPAKGFVKSFEGNLWRFDTSSYPSHDWKNLKSLTGVSVNSAPHGCISDPIADKGMHIFIRDSNNHLLEIEEYYAEDGELEWKVTDHHFPGNSRLCFSPFVCSFAHYSGYETTGITTTVLHIFSAGSQNSIIERKVRLYNGEEIWNEYRDPYETALTPSLSWEYWNKTGWVVLKEITDGTADLLNSGQITFLLPEDIEGTETSGQKSYWIRARIVGGDYGTETFALTQKSTYLQGSVSGSGAQQLVSTKNTIRPPIINSLTVAYSLERYAERCIAYNNLEYLDHSEACKVAGKCFSPFVELEDEENALYLGFDGRLEKAPIKIFFAARELYFTDGMKPKLRWRYSAEKDWARLNCLDATEALVRADILELVGPSDFSARSCLGDYLHWIKANLVEGAYEESPVLHGIYPNTTWGVQEETVEDEILGSSDGTADQEFGFMEIPVIAAEIWVNEIATLSEEEKEMIKEENEKDSISESKDEAGKVTEVWVRWRPVEDFFDSSSDSRHYLVDRVSGEVRFGDGVYGMVPPVGRDNIRATYQVGGGEVGNVLEFEVSTLKTAIPYVDSVINTWSAGGGANIELLEAAMERGPWVVKHRNRAVTTEDFEWLAKQASRDVIRATCMRNDGGSVMVIILPKSSDDKPVPSLALKKLVKKYLSERCSNVISLQVKGPEYVEVSVLVDLYPVSMDAAPLAEREALERLGAFLHPLTGGEAGEGWEFGRLVCLSDIYAVLEGIAEIDHVENLRVVPSGTMVPDALICSGEHQVTIKFGEVT